MATRAGFAAPAVDTANQVLDIAERLAQTRGFNGFSYADISEEIGLTKATLHYHFRTKAEMGRRLLARYSETFQAALADINGTYSGAPEQLAAYVQLYAEVLRGHRMCLCGMLAAEYATLAAPMQDEIRRFFDMNEEWLAQVADGGRTAGTLHFEGPPREIGRLLLGSLEGAMLVARSYDDVERFEASAARLLQDLRNV